MFADEPILQPNGMGHSRQVEQVARSRKLLTFTQPFASGHDIAKIWRRDLAVPAGGCLAVARDIILARIGKDYPRPVWQGARVLPVRFVKLQSTRLLIFEFDHRHELCRPSMVDGLQ